MWITAVQISAIEILAHKTSELAGKAQPEQLVEGHSLNPHELVGKAQLELTGRKRTALILTELIENAQPELVECL
jgi:hypothetical protein